MGVGSGRPEILPLVQHTPLYARSLSAEAQHVGTLRRELNAALLSLDMSAQRRGDIALVVSEALTNATVHAYVGLPLGPVALAATVADGSLHVSVADEGLGMVPRADCPGAGMGVGLMGHLADGLKITSPGGLGTEVCVRFAL